MRPIAGIKMLVEQYGINTGPIRWFHKGTFIYIFSLKKEEILSCNWLTSEETVYEPCFLWNYAVIWHSKIVNLCVMLEASKWVS